MRAANRVAHRTRWSGVCRCVGTSGGQEEAANPRAGGVGRAPTVLSFAAAFALPLPERTLLAFVSIFLKNGAFFRISGSTMKRTWLPRKKQLRQGWRGGGECGGLGGR